MMEDVYLHLPAICSPHMSDECQGTVSKRDPHRLAVQEYFRQAKLCPNVCVLYDIALSTHVVCSGQSRLLLCNDPVM